MAPSSSSSLSPSSSLVPSSEDDDTTSSSKNTLSIERDFPARRSHYQPQPLPYAGSHNNNKGPMVPYVLYDSKEFLCGWGSALINTCITFPINKLIFRQQLHGISGLHAFRQLHKDGLRHLYRGLLPPLLQKTTSISIMFGAYTKSRETLQNTLPSYSPRTLTILSALIAGTIEATLTPFERVQTLMQTRKYHNRFTNTFDAFTALRRFGFREYYRGLSVLILRNGPSNCLFFLGREYLTVPEANTSAGEKFAKDFVSGACLGALISTFFFPFNVMKTHMQATVGGPFVSIWTTFRSVLAVRDGKIKDLYKGVHLNYTRSFLAWGIINASYETLMKCFTPYGASDIASRKH